MFPEPSGDARPVILPALVPLEDRHPVQEGGGRQTHLRNRPTPPFSGPCWYAGSLADDRHGGGVVSRHVLW